MKKFIYGTIAIAVLGFTSCSSVKNDVSHSSNKTGKKEQKFILTTENSLLAWDGHWVGGQNDGKSHNGTIVISSGTVNLKGESYHGNFTVDMNTIKCLDIHHEESNASLVEDLESEYFFKVTEFPETKVDIKSISLDSAYVTVEALGVPITQTLPIKMAKEKNTLHLTGSFVFDFQKANIRELFAHPEEHEMGGLTSKVKFNLDAELVKE